MAALAGWRVRARKRDLRLLVGALAASVVLHVAFALGFPQWVAREHMRIVPGAIRARLAAPEAPPAQVPRAEPARDGTAAREPPPQRSAVRGPPSARTESSDASASAAAGLPPPAATPAAAPGAEPAPASAAEPAPPAVAPPAERAAAIERERAAAAGFSAAEEANTLAQYRIALMEAARAFRRYPRLARENNWQGRVTVRVAIAPGGALAAVAVASSSGYPVLDQQALDMLRSAQARTPVPPALRGREFSVEIPVIFDLREE
ncbi:MAG: energy transducer TonB [Burkholderiales bacterium]|nr:energy transducer TonB [Burkholderiales bacterium]